MMYGLTLWRPWSWSIVHGSKRIENRSWFRKSLAGQWIALHAGKTWDYEGAAKIAEVHPEIPRSADAHPLGIVGVARVVGAYELWAEQAPEGMTWEAHGRWAFGPWCWVLDDVRAIEPVPCRGAQGLWPLPADVLARVRERWKAARVA